MTSRKVKIVRIPLPIELKKDYPKSFPKMPISYLELIENKSKIKSELRNTEYIPKEVEKSDAEKSDVDKSVEKSVEKSVNKSTENSDDNSDVEKSDDYETDNENSDNEEKDDKSRGRSGQTPEKSTRREDEESGYSDTGESRKSSISSASTSSSKHKKKRKGKDIISHRLKQLLGNEDTTENYTKAPEKNNSHLNVPSLSELQKTGKVQIKKELEDIPHTTLSEQEQEDAKRELIFKFDILKKSYKTDNIPEFSIHSDYNTMKKSYENTLRTLSLDKSVEDYKRYLIGGFMIIEFVFGNWMGFDMQGFTQQQIISMNSYERLLIELGEKSYIPTGSKWPVEIRLLFLVIMNAAFFIIGKMILKKTGSNLMGMINNMNTTSAPQATAPAKKRKMKGPSINIDDIPDIEDE